MSPAQDANGDPGDSSHRTRGRAGRGRKSTLGRARSATNSLRHGLSIRVLVDPAASAAVDALAREITASLGAPDDPAGTLRGLARRIAEAQLELLRVRRARHDLIGAARADPDHLGRRFAPALEALRVHATRLAARGDWFARVVAHELARPQPQGVHRDALILIDLAPRLDALDRYERRARSRRKFAIRAYDEHRAALVSPVIPAKAGIQGLRHVTLGGDERMNVG